MRVAIKSEWLKLRRSRVTLTIGFLVAFAIPLMSYAFYWVADSGGFGPLAVKADGLIVGTGWDGLFSSSGQIVAAAAFLAFGVAAAWCYGREFADRTFPSLFALAVSRRTISLAKLVVLLLGSLLAVVVMTLVIGALGLMTSLEVSSTSIVGGLGRVFAIGLLSALLAVVAGLVASIGRGYLPALGLLIGLVAIAQLAVLFGTGGWFPFAVPGLIAVAGAEGVPAVTGVQIALVPLLCAVIAFLTARWWGSAQAV